ncbi:ATP-grasp domain-containing protein [Agrobacterium vitis]|uniref:ATP-grasp domain-containing protein n=1 Tax=Agrobacterium vitis TaxID=373 RepID=UPI003D2C3AE6
MSVVAVLESNLAGNGAKVIQAAKNKGYKTLFVCGNKEEYNNAIINPVNFADEVAIVDSYDIAKLLSFFSTYPDKIEVVMAFDDFRMIQAAIINEFLCINNSASVKSLINVRFKNLLREKLKDSEYFVKFKVLDNTDKNYNEPLEYPCVIKPVDESGSVGVKICRTKSESDDAIRYIMSLPKYNGRGFTVSKKILVEEYIEGPEFSAELVWDAHTYEWKLLGITKKFVTSGPFCVERAHIFPYADGSAFAKDVECHANKIFEKIGLKNTFVHMEFKFDNRRFSIIEINPRLAGGMIIELMNNAKGLNAAELMLEASLNLPLSAVNNVGPDKASAIFYITDDHKGNIIDVTVDDADFLSQINIYPLPKKINGLRSNEDRLGYVLLSNGNYSLIEERVRFYLDGNGIYITKS